MSNYANDITLHTLDYKLEERKNTLRFDFDLVTLQFEKSYIDLNAYKWQFMYLAKDGKNGTFIFNYFILITTMK